MSRFVLAGPALRCGAALAAVALAAPVVVRWASSAPDEVASRYVVATGGDLAALEETTGRQGQHSSAEGALRAVYGVARPAPVRVTYVGDVVHEFADIGHVVVSGTADGVPFTTDVTLETHPFGTRVVGEYAPDGR